MRSRLAVAVAGLTLAACASVETVKPPAASVSGNFTLDYAAQPLGIDSPAPRFGWHLPATGDGRQSAYRIRVVASVEQFESAPLWDSGKVASAAVSQIAYAGPALTSRSKYFWQVQTWDGADAASGWSQPQSFEMGLLQPSDWSAQWISGRTSVDHDWKDSKLTIDFTLNKPASVLLRARPIGKTYGEAYVWTIAEEGGSIKLVEQVRRYAGGNSSKVNSSTLRNAPIAKDAVAWKAQRHQMVVTLKGGELVTSIDGAVIDTVNDNVQTSGTIGFAAADPEAMIVHAVKVEAEGQNFSTDFSDGINPFTGGSIVEGGLKIAAGVPDKDVVLPLSAPAPLLRREFELASAPVSARLYLAAGGLPKTSINGQNIGEAMQDGYTDYSKRVLYRTFDVTSTLKAGKNSIGIELGRGWYGVTEPNEWYWHQAPWHAAPTVRAQLEVTLADGSKQTITSDESWKFIDGPTRHDSVYAGERYDARLAPLGWQTAGFDDAAWSKANVVTGPAGKLVAAQQEPIAVTGAIKPVAITEPRPGIYVYDFGRIFAGRLRLNISGKAGSTVRLVQTEKLAQDGTVSVVSGLIDAQLQTDQYTLSGKGREVWSPSFGYRGFRYVQVEGLAAKPALDLLTGEQMHSNVAINGHFESSNPLINQIQAAAQNTLLNNMHGNQTDTPTLEKNGWTGDAQASALANILNFGTQRVWTKWMADFRDAQSAKGEIPEIVPSTPYYGYENTPGWGAVWGPIPSWDAATFILPWEMYLQLGDRAILADMYETQKKLVDYTGTYFAPGTLTYKNPNNFLLGEYASVMPPGGIIAALRAMPNGPIDATAAAYYYHMLDLLSRSAAMLGKTDDAAKYRGIADEMRKAYNTRYWNADAGTYKMPAPTKEYAQTPNTLAVAFGLAPQGSEAAIVKSLNDDIVARNYHLGAGVYAGRYLMTLLGDYGYADTAFKVATATDHPSWGWWIGNGLSTMAEGWGLDSRSWDHHYWGSISSYFYQSLAGIRAVTPGYEKARIQPRIPQGLDWVKASLGTPYGEVASEWKVSGKSLSLQARIPAGMEAEVWVPAKAAGAVQAPAGVSLARFEDGYAVYRVGQGSHAFKSELN